MELATEVQQISTRISKLGFRKTSVLIKEVKEKGPCKSMELIVFVDKDVTDIEKIKIEAIKNAEAFIGEVAENLNAR